MTIITIIHTVASIGEQYGGPSRSVPGLCDALCSAGAKVLLFSIHANGEIQVLPTSTNVKVINVGKESGFQGLNLKKFNHELKIAIKEANATIVHDHGIWLPCNHTVASVTQYLKIKRVVSPRGMLEPWAMGFRKFKKGLAWLLYQKSDLITASGFHATARAEAENIRKLGFKQPVAVIPNGVSVPENILGKPKRSKADNRIALYLSRIHPIKGISNLIDAWEALRPNGWRLLIVGPEEAGHRSEIQGKIMAKGLEGCVELRGEVNEQEKWELYKSSDLFVLPSFSENFGIVVAEALAAGVPVITTKGTPWSDLQEYQCGWWVDIGVEPLVQALKEAFQMEPARLSEMGVRGAKLVESKYSWPQIGKQMLEFYEWLLGIGPKPTCLFD